jgi:hypothetical protein
LGHAIVHRRFGWACDVAAGGSVEAVVNAVGVQQGVEIGAGDRGAGPGGEPCGAGQQREFGCRLVGGIDASTVAIARVNDTAADLLLLGDSYIAYRLAGTTTVLTDDRLDQLGLSQSRLYRERLAAGSGYGPAHTDLLRQLQVGQRARRNVPGGYWIASADPEAARNAITVTLPVASLEWIVLATDGAADTIRRLGLDDWDAIARSDQAGLSAILEHCHEWEENADPDGSQYPRAKRHDDKAIAAIRLN